MLDFIMTIFNDTMFDIILQKFQLTRDQEVQIRVDSISQSKNPKFQVRKITRHVILTCIMYLYYYTNCKSNYVP